MARIVAVTGNEAVAEALRQTNPDVCAAYPITPATDLMQRFASFVANGQVDTELILVESEHSAMSACIGAAAGWWKGCNCNKQPGACTHVGDAIYRRWYKASDNNACGEQVSFCSSQHSWRPF